MPTRRGVVSCKVSNAPTLQSDLRALQHEVHAVGCAAVGGKRKADAFPSLCAGFLKPRILLLCARGPQTNNLVFPNKRRAALGFKGTALEQNKESSADEQQGEDRESERFHRFGLR